MLWLLYVPTPNPQPFSIQATLKYLLIAISKQSVFLKILDPWHVCVLNTDMSWLLTTILIMKPIPIEEFIERHYNP